MCTTAQTPRLVLALLLIAPAAVAALDGAFPRWRGDGAGSAGDPGVPLVDSWDEARVLWVSELRSPHPWNYSVVRGRTGWPRTVLGNGGYCMPSVADGKVYISFWRPSGEVHAETGRKDKWVKSGIPALTLIGADAVIACLDATTGRTLWETSFPGKELNHIELYGGHNNVCVADGRVHAIGNSGWIYTVDAQNGKKLWEAPVGHSAERWADFRARCLEHRVKTEHIDSKQVPPATPHPQGGSLNATTYNMCPVVADGVVVTGEWSRGRSMVGFDAATGKELWRNDRAGTGVIPPILWRHAGKDFIIRADKTIRCYDPRTGEELWEDGRIGNTGYWQATAAIHGDLLVAHGAWKEQRKREQRPPSEQEGWICYRLSTTGVDKVWSLDAAYRGTSYVAPVIHDGHAWFNFQRDPDATSGLRNLQEQRGASHFACVEMATGRVRSEQELIPLNNVCPGLAAMGDLLFYQGDRYVWLMKLDPDEPRFLGAVPQPVNFCSSGSVAGGLAFFRGGERLVVCLDLRKPSARPAPSQRHDDPANARYTLELPQAQRDGRAARLHLHGRDGDFSHAWITVPPRHLHPDIIEADALQLDGDHISGPVVAWMDDTRYAYDLDLHLKEGVVDGTYRDRYQGQAVDGAVSGTMRARAHLDCDFDIMWPRHWFNGQNQWHEHRMSLSFADGAVRSVAIIPKREKSTAFSVTIDEHDLAFDGERLTGSMQTTVTAKEIINPGTYRLRFDVRVINNLTSGTVYAQRTGARESAHPVEGSVSVDATVPVDPQQAVFTVELADSLLPKMLGRPCKTTLHLTTDGETIAHAAVHPDYTGGSHRIDASGLRLTADGLRGQVETWVYGDGYIHRGDTHNIYQIEADIAGTALTGSYTGTYDARESREGPVEGVYRNP